MMRRSHHCHPIYPPLPPDEPTRTPPPLPPGTPPPISPDAPWEKTTNVKKGKKQEAANKKEEETKRALAELRNRCADSLKPFVDKHLSEEEWHEFCELLQKLPGELKEITSKLGQRRGDPTRNWRRRQQRKARKEGGNNNNNKTGGNERKGKGDDKPKGDRRKDNNNNNKRRKNDNGRRDDQRRDDRRARENNQRRRDDVSRRRDDRRPREHDRENRRDRDSREKTSHRMTERQRKSLQVKELQMSYRRGAKRCIEKLLGDTQERHQCGIPPSTIYEQMSKSYSRAGRGSDKPAWIEDPDREKTDVLEAPFAADEVRRQLRRLPAYSYPLRPGHGTVGVRTANR